MRYGLIVVAALCLGFVASSYVRADDEKKTNDGKIHGVLIDNHCAGKFADKEDPQAAAMEHKKDCCLKCGKDGGYAVISGKKVIKLDDEGNKKAEKFLENEKHGTSVVIEGEEKDGTLAVKSIHADKKHEEKKEG